MLNLQNPEHLLTPMKPTIEAKPQSVITLESSERMWRDKFKDHPAYETRGQVVDEQIRREIYLIEDASLCAWIDHYLYGQPGIAL